MAAMPSANGCESGGAQTGHSDLGIDIWSRGTTPQRDLEEGAESEAGNGSSSLDVYETDEEGTDFGDGETEDPGATEKTMRSVLREIPERTEEEEPGEEADARSTADEANGAEAEQPDSPASALGEPIQLPDHPRRSVPFRAMEIGVVPATTLPWHLQRDPPPLHRQNWRRNSYHGASSPSRWRRAVGCTASRERPLRA